MAIDFTSPTGQVRLLLNDIDENAPIFSDVEIRAFLSMEDGRVKRAAAQAIDTNATNMVLAAKVFRSQDVQLDGAKMADAMRKHADQLRAQDARAVVDADDDFYFGVISL